MPRMPIRAASKGIFLDSGNRRWGRALKAMAIKSVPAFAAAATLCCGASIFGAVVISLRSDHVVSYPSNRVERRQLAMKQSHFGQLPLPVKALKASVIPVNILAANLDAAERADAAVMSAQTLPDSPAFIGSKNELERRVAKLE
jgi:hypothetical protein